MFMFKGVNLQLQSIKDTKSPEGLVSVICEYFIPKGIEVGGSKFDSTLTNKIADFLGILSFIDFEIVSVDSRKGVSDNVKKAAISNLNLKLDSCIKLNQGTFSSNYAGSICKYQEYINQDENKIKAFNRVKVDSDILLDRVDGYIDTLSVEDKDVNSKDIISAKYLSQVSWFRFKIIQLTIDVDKFQADKKNDTLKKPSQRLSRLVDSLSNLRGFFKLMLDTFSNKIPKDFIKNEDNVKRLTLDQFKNKIMSDPDGANSNVAALSKLFVSSINTTKDYFKTEKLSCYENLSHVENAIGEFSSLSNRLINIVNGLKKQNVIANKEKLKI